MEQDCGLSAEDLSGTGFGLWLLRAAPITLDSDLISTALKRGETDARVKGNRLNGFLFLFADSPPG